MGAAVPGGAGTRAADRGRRACGVAAAGPRRGRSGPHAGDTGPHGRLAGPDRGLRGDRAGHGGGHRSAWRGGGNRGPDRIPGGAAPGPRHAAGRGTTRTAATGGRQAPRPVPPSPRVVPVRQRGLQSRLHPFRPGPVGGVRTGRRRHGPRGRHPCGDGRRRKTSSPRGGIRTGPTSWSPSLRASMPDGRPGAGTSSGATAMYRPGPRWTWPGP